MKKIALIAMLSLLATPALADPWEGKELGADSQSASVRCQKWTGDGIYRASEVSLYGGVYRVIRNDKNDVVYLPGSDCRVIVAPARALVNTIQTK